MTIAIIEISAKSVLQSLWRASWQAMALAVLVLLIQWLLGPRIGGRGRYLLWSVVILRLMLPALPQSPTSIYNLSRAAPESAKQKAEMSFVEAPIAQERSAIPAAAEPTRVTLAPTLPPAPTWTIPQILVIAWFLGAAVIVIRLIVASSRWRKSIGALRPTDDPRLVDIVTTAARELSVKNPPAVLAGEHVPTPAVVGLIRPRLLLPGQVVNGCTAEELRLVVLHELAHIKRHDIAANWLVAAACIVHWFNPFVWLIAARIRTDRELACDETVLAACATSDSQAYGRTLLRLIEVLSPTPADRYPQLVGILESSAPMQRRMRMIARYTPQSSSRWVWVGLVLIALGCTSLTDSVRGQAPQQRPATQPAARSPERGDPGDAPPAGPSLQVLLRKNVPEVRFDGVEFSKVIDFYRDFSGANIFVNWRALEAAGISRDAQVTLRLRDVPFEQALTRTLREVSGGAVRLDYVIEGNVLSITTDEDAASETRTVFYDVTDLLLSPDGTPLPTADRQQTVDALVVLIQDTLARETWRDNGGNIGSAREFRGKLIVTQIPKVHLQIEDLLARVREKPTTQPRPLTALK